MWINHDKKFVFIAVPKCGSTSSLNTLGFDVYSSDLFQGLPPEQLPPHWKVSAKMFDLGGPALPPVYHASINDVLLTRPVAVDYKSFGFVRNPWDRIVSVFMDGVRNEAHQVYWSSGLLKYKTFSEFILDFEKTDWPNQVHFLPSCDFLTKKDKTEVDYIGKYENLCEDFARITEEITGRAISLGLHHNKTNRNVDYRLYYNNESRKVIERVYKEDIERFNYEY